MTGLDGITDKLGPTAWWGPELEADVEDERFEELVGEVMELPRPRARELVAGSSRRYLALRLLGKSRHAKVYLALDRVLTRRVVLKVHEDEEGREEARLASAARHPNVVEIHDFGVHEGRSYTVLAYCEGTSLEAWCKGKPWRVIVDRIIEAGRGLQHCHDNLIIHGDVKPQNILVTQGRAVVSDFGLAGPPRMLLEAGGTPGYIAPELALEKRRGPATDVFALAVTAWWCLFGELPFKGNSVAASFLRSLESEPDKPESVPRGLPREVTAVLKRGLVADREERPRMGPWVAALAKAAKTPERKRARRWQAARVALVVVIGVLTLATNDSVRGACVGDGKALVLEEPTMERALAHAKEGDPFGAYSVWWRMTEQNTDMQTERVLELAELMLKATNKRELDDRSAAAWLTQRVAARAGSRANAASNEDQMKRAGDVWDATEEIIQDTKPSHPR